MNGDAGEFRDGTRATTRRVGRAVFGGRTGLALFLGALCFVTLTWRAGVFINDNFTLVWTLEALSEGRTWIVPAGNDAFLAPGTSERDGFVYGRNYGQLVVTLPVLWILQGVDTIFDLHVALVATWHLLALAFVLQVGRLTEYRLESQLGGSLLVGSSFLVNVALARAFVNASLYQLALQVTAAIAAALLAVFLYRLLERRHGRAVGLFAGVAVVVATPIGFWATIPKRHVLGAAVAVVVLYAFARSREENEVAIPAVGPVPAYRAGAYALVGLWAWVHAAEALFMFFALVAVDVPTAPSNDRRSLAVVGVAFALSLVPFLVTNSLVTGEMLRPPRAMDERGLAAPAQENLTSPGDGGSGGSGGGTSDSSGGLADTVEGFVGSLGAGPVGVIVGQVLGITVRGVTSLFEFEALSQTFLFSNVESINQNLAQTQFLGINLAVLEAAPVLGVVLGAVAGATTRVQRVRESLDATDALAVLFCLAFVLVYNSRLPLNTQVTVRDLLVLYPLGIFLLARSRTVRRLLTDHRSALLWSYTVGVAIGGQLLVAYFVLGQYAVGEAARVHALLGFLLGTALAVVSVASVVERRVEPLAAATLGLAGAAGTIFFLLATLAHFAFVGEYVLPVVGALSDLLSAVG